MSVDPDASRRSSALTPLSEASHTVNVHSPTTPTPQDSVSNRRTELPGRPNPERTSRLPSMPELTERTNARQTEELQAMIAAMQSNLQQQLQKQQQDFESRIETLMIGKGKNPEAINSSVDKASASTTLNLNNELQDSYIEPINDADIGIASNDPIEPQPKGSRFPSTHHSQYVREPSYPFHTHRNANPPAPAHISHSRVKASDLPKFKGDKGEDVEVWIEQVSAIFGANRCSDEEIVAFLSVILKDTALKWFTRLGLKGRSPFPTWSDWQDALRQRFLKANYLAEKKRLWKKRDLRSNEDMVDYFDAKVDLQAYVFDETTPESELILDILDGLPEHMLPTLKSSISADTDLLEFRRILLDYEKGLRWNGPWNARKSDGNTFANNRPHSHSNDRNKGPSTGKPIERDTTKPPKPCKCGGMHWYRDCPKRTTGTRSNNVSSYRPASAPNKLPTTGRGGPAPTTS
jgi:hypothetical protein